MTTAACTCSESTSRRNVPVRRIVHYFASKKVKSIEYVFKHAFEQDCPFKRLTNELQLRTIIIIITDILEQISCTILWSFGRLVFELAVFALELRDTRVQIVQLSCTLSFPPSFCPTSDCDVMSNTYGTILQPRMIMIIISRLTGSRTDRAFTKSEKFRVFRPPPRCRCDRECYCYAIRTTDR